MGDENERSGIHHPNIHPTLSTAIEKAEEDGVGFFIESLKEGDVVMVKTRNSEYSFTIQNIKKSRAYMKSNNARFTDEVVTINGSTYGGSVIKLGWVGTEMSLECYIHSESKTFKTSCVEEVVVHHS